MSMDKFRYLILFLTIVLSVACTTPAGIRENPPSIKYQSKKGSQAVAMCIADKWESGGLFGSTVPVSMRPTPNGFTVSLAGAGNTMLLVDVEPFAGGSQTSYFKGIVWGEGSFDLIVKECQ